MKKLAIAIACIFPVAEPRAEEPPKRVYESARLADPKPVIDGKLDDRVWSSKEGWQGRFVQLTPEEGKPRSAKTRFKLVYDDDNLYGAIDCRDEPAKVRRIFGPRDQSVGDLAGFAFDSYFNHQTAYEFDLTAAGQKVDVMYLGGPYNYDFNWNPIWEGATALGDSGWTAEFRIPLSQLRYNNVKDQIWGLHVWRNVDRLREETHWNLIPSSAVPGSHNFGLLRGISGIRSSRQTEFLPYLSLKSDYNGASGDPGSRKLSLRPNGGLDAKMGISSNFTLDATLNPDFGQVEADPSELNLTAYETYFEEKRPFFLEGRDIFDFKVGSLLAYNVGEATDANQLFYSRRIGAEPHFSPALGPDETFSSPDQTRILGSVKLSGRTRGGLSIGVLETVTGEEDGERARIGPDGAVTGKERVPVEPYTNYLSLRLREESADANTQVGGSFNSVLRDVRAEDDLSADLAATATTAGLDFKQQVLDKNYYLTASAFSSLLTGSRQAIAARQASELHFFQRPGAPYLRFDTARTYLEGAGGFAEIGKQGGVFQFWANGAAYSPGLDLNDMGYLKEADRLQQQAGIFIYENDPFAFFNVFKLDLKASNAWTFGKERVDSRLQTDLWGSLSNLWELYAEGAWIFPSLDTRVLRGGPALYQDGYARGLVSVKTNPSKRVIGEVRSGCSLNPGIGYQSRDYGLKLTTNPVDRLSLSIEAGYEKSDKPFEYLDDLPAGLPLVGRLGQQTASLTLRAELFVTPRISFQYYGTPFISAVDFSEFKRVVEAGAESPAKRFRPVGASEIAFDAAANSYTVAEAGGSAYSFDNPDRSFGEFRSNFVFRWEYQPGSLFYFVWSRQQASDRFRDNPKPRETGEELIHAAARDVLMAKISYWFNL